MRLSLILKEFVAFHSTYLLSVMSTKCDEFWIEFRGFSYGKRELIASLIWIIEPHFATTLDESESEC